MVTIARAAREWSRAQITMTRKSAERARQIARADPDAALAELAKSNALLADVLRAQAKTNRWSRSDIIAAIGVVIALLTLLVTVAPPRGGGPAEVTEEQVIRMIDEQLRNAGLASPGAVRPDETPRAARTQVEPTR